tara:strand:- start:2362 stop:2943 length:582 start_codon:yes stop_codon:yes gene_type:complete
MSGNSPYARRARITIREAKLQDQVEEVAINSFAELASIGPGGKIPVLVTDSGLSICESLIITRYLNELACTGLLPEGIRALESCFALESTGSALMDSLFVRSFENNQRQEQTRSPIVLEREQERSKRCYDALEAIVRGEGKAVSVGTIAAIAALGYADWRAPEDGWREGRPTLHAYYDRIMKRPAFADTAPVF